MVTRVGNIEQDIGILEKRGNALSFPGISPEEEFTVIVLFYLYREVGGVYYKYDKPNIANNPNSHRHISASLGEVGLGRFPKEQRDCSENAGLYRHSN